MRKTIPPDRDLSIPARRPSIVAAEPGSRHVIIEVDGVRHRLGPDEARAMAQSLLRAASVASPPPVEPTDDLDDDLL